MMTKREAQMGSQNVASEQDNQPQPYNKDLHNYGVQVCNYSVYVLWDEEWSTNCVFNSAGASSSAWS